MARHTKDMRISKALNAVDSKVLGDTLKEYFSSSVYDTQWEGNTEQEVSAIVDMLEDLLRFVDAVS